MRRLGTRSTCSRASPRKRFRSLPRRRSAICCKRTHGPPFEGGATLHVEKVFLGCGIRALFGAFAALARVTDKISAAETDCEFPRGAPKGKPRRCTLRAAGSRPLSV